VIDLVLGIAGLWLLRGYVVVLDEDLHGDGDDEAMVT
jgi:hypothetical protein